ncbi:glycosyl hydrolase [Talaromyces pinophilus]|uniref:Glycosyl hydrolase n=1 Tax=Talaromyces pinophilus TaxID=128442 RepID=A0A510NVC9_TALPI|nr:glycosyl hydrolase [Talaromyces pinophilus]
MVVILPRCTRIDTESNTSLANRKASHAATTALTTESFYGNLTGAFFSGHPEIQSATYQVSNPTHPAVSSLPPTWEHYDEIYQYHQDPRENNIILLLSAIQSSYSATATSGGVVSPIQLTPGGPPQPIAWFRDASHQLAPDLIHNGRLFQTGLGHAKETWLYDTLFRDHIYGGIQWLLGLNVTNSAPGVTTGI